MGLHDERHAFPQAVDVGAAELVLAVEAVHDGGPVGTELEEDGAAAGGLDISEPCCTYTYVLQKMGVILCHIRP